MSETLKYNVNIDLANKTKQEMAEHLETSDRRVLNKIGAFSSLYDINFPEYNEPVLVLKTEEPGSKQIIAMQYDKIENVCCDMINHLINDCIVMGAKPLTVQDAIICGKMDSDIIKRCVKTIAEACKKQDCVLTGGETSEQPGVIENGTYILTSSIVGIVEKSKIIDGSRIREGDVVLGLESSGIHTNGYTLVRSIMARYPAVKEKNVGGRNFIDAILEPHRCYYKALRDLFDKSIITGLAHITGGGIKENLDRILPEGLDAEVDLSKYVISDLFKVLKTVGDIEDDEMLRTFNMGVGLAVVTAENKKDEIMKHCAEQGVHCFEIGRIIRGNRKVITTGKFIWD